MDWGERVGLLEGLCRSLREFKTCCSSICSEPPAGWELWWYLLGSASRTDPWRMNLTFLAGDPVQEPEGTVDVSLQHSTGVHHLTKRASVLGWAALGLRIRNSVTARLMHPRESFSAASSVGILWCCGTLNSPGGAYCATMEHPSEQTLATDSFGIWSCSERPKEFLLSRYKNLHSFLWAKQAGFLLVWILLVVQFAKKSASLEKSSYH